MAHSELLPDSAFPLVVFAYDFPHRKSYDVITRLVAAGLRPSAVLGAPAVQLSVPAPAVRVKPRHLEAAEPAALCASLGVPYFAVDHQSEDCLLILGDLRPRLGVVAGARVLRAAVLDHFPGGVINLHPGLLPWTRGLDALQWAIFHELPLGVTAHVVDSRVDAGWLLERRRIEEYPDDTFVDLSLRLYETQLLMLAHAVRAAASTPRSVLPSLHRGPYRSSFPPELVPVLQRRFRERLARLARGEHAAFPVSDDVELPGSTAWRESAPRDQCVSGVENSG